MAGRTELLVKSFQAEGSILRNRFVKPGTAAGSLLTAAAATDLIIGVSSNIVDVLAGDMCDGILQGIANLKLGGTVTYGARLTSDSTGRGIAATGTARVGGIAMAAGVVNDIIPVLLYPSNIEGIGSITASAAEINILDGVTATTAELNLLDPDVAPAYHKIPRVVKKPLNAVDTAGGLFSHSFGVAVIVSRVILNVTTQSTAACTVDIGVAANGTTLNDGLIDGLSVAATGTFDNLLNAGTNGRSRQAVGSTQFVTGSVASGASAGLVGTAYIEFFEA
ncbi:MAG: hypothetical protein SFT94_02240 [Pseudanabaenaceae cyanobacterium bins.68]|nr:hypothetical protein [Pseudanabaenaceae cyanobacterium bins.68]